MKVNVSAISHLVGMCYMGLLAMEDYRRKTISIRMLILGGVGAVCYQILKRELPIGVILAGLGAGLGFVMLSKITREAFGYGDGILIGILGIYLGFWGLMEVLFWAFLLVFLCSVLVTIRNPFRRKNVLPFVPFLGAGYVLFYLLGGL